MIVYQHIATFDSLQRARDWIPTMYTDQELPNSWIGFYKEQGSALWSYDFAFGTASEFAYKTMDPYLELTGSYRARGPGGLQLTILECKNYRTGDITFEVTKYRGFAKPIGENRYKVY